MNQPQSMNAAGKCHVDVSHASFGKPAVQPDRIYPNLETVLGRVLGALLNGDHLTHHDALNRFATSRLAAHIHHLRKQEGWRIEMTIIQVRTHDHGRSARIADYWLEPSTIASAGGAGQLYARACRETERGQEKS